MREENKKEILTREIIKKELKEVYLYNGLCWLHDFAVAILCYAVLYVLVPSVLKGRIDNFSQIAVTIINIVVVGFIIIAITGFAATLYCVCKFFGLLIITSKGKFEIVVDKLVDMKKMVSYNDEVLVEEVQDHKIRPRIRIFKIDIPSTDQYYYRLRFEKYKGYELPEGKLYNWSEINSMNDWQIFRSANIGDEFYLVVANGKVLYAYNTKYFELQE